MPLALILSSHVAASRVGGMAQSLALSQFSCDGMLVPTVLYGRHPGWGAPGGAAVPLQAFEGMLDGIEANGLFGLTDLVITGYFASVEQVRAAVRAIDAVRAAPRDAIAYTKAARIIVDPTIGDTGKGLYVPQNVADAIRDDLCPRTDIICPNAWELEWLTGLDARDPQNAVRAALATLRVGSGGHAPECDQEAACGRLAPLRLRTLQVERLVGLARKHRRPRDLKVARCLLQLLELERL
jgi:pyridoxine kinase